METARADPVSGSAARNAAMSGKPSPRSARRPRWVSFMAQTDTARERHRLVRDYRASSKAVRAMARSPAVADGGSAAVGLASIATTTKVWPLLFVAR